MIWSVLILHSNSFRYCLDVCIQFEIEVEKEKYDVFILLDVLRSLIKKVSREDFVKEIYIFEAGEDVAPDPEER